MKIDTNSSAQSIFFLPLEFIHLISAEANEICEKESKKTIAPEHILTALKVKMHAFWGGKKKLNAQRLISLGIGI